MTPINWPEIIRALVDKAGLTQPEIARLCGCGQSTISDLLRGNTTDPRTSTGLVLLGLAKQHGVADPAWPQPAVRTCLDLAPAAIGGAQPAAHAHLDPAGQEPSHAA